MSQKIQRWICIDQDCQQQRIIDTAQDLIQHSKLGHKLITYQIFSEQIKKYFTDANKSKLNNEEYYNQMKIEIQNYIQFYSQTIKELENNYLKIFDESYDIIYPRTQLIDLTKSIINEENIELSMLNKYIDYFRRQFEPNSSEIKQFIQLQNSISFLCCQKVDLIDNFKKNLVIRQPPDICKIIPEVIQKKKLKFQNPDVLQNAESPILKQQQLEMLLDKYNANQFKIQQLQIQKRQNDLDFQTNSSAQNELFKNDNESIQYNLNQFELSLDQQQQQYQQQQQQQQQQKQESNQISLEFNQQIPQIENKNEVNEMNNEFQLLAFEPNKLMQTIEKSKHCCKNFDKLQSSQDIEYLGNTASCGNIQQNIYFKRIKFSNPTKKLVFQYKLLSESRNCDIQIGAINFSNHDLEDMQGVYLLKSQGEVVFEQEIQHCGKQINLLCDSTITCSISKKPILNIHQTISSENDKYSKKIAVRIPLKKSSEFIDYRIIVRIKNIQIELLL